MNRRCQNSWLMTAYGAVPGARLLPRIESLADDRRNAERREVGGRHEANGDLFSLAVCDAGLGPLQVALRRHHRRERAVLVLQLAEFRVREERAFASLRAYRHAARFGVRQNDDLVRVADGQRAHQHAAHEAEDRRVRANAQGQRQHGNDGEARVRRKDADGVSKVLCDHVLMLPEGGWQEIDEGFRPDNSFGEPAAGEARVVQLLGEGAQHLAAVLVAELRRIAQQKRTIDTRGPHRPRSTAFVESASSRGRGSASR